MTLTSDDWTRLDSQFSRVHDRIDRLAGEVGELKAKATALEFSGITGAAVDKMIGSHEDGCRRHGATIAKIVGIILGALIATAGAIFAILWGAKS